MDNNSDIGSWLKLFFGLPQLPANEVEDAFVEDIMPNATQDPEVEKFCDYICDTYITSDSRFPPRMWARMPDDPQLPTTTNGAEAFHRNFKRCFQSSNPNIFMFAHELKGLQEDTYIKLQSVLRVHNFCQVVFSVFV